jgi:hypothetical protein
MDSQEVQRLATALDSHTSAICALIEAMGMQAENKILELSDKSVGYDERDFLKVIAKHNLTGF